MRGVAGTWVLGVLALAGCGGTWTGAPQRDYEGNGVGMSDGATVVTAEELHTANGPLLSAITGKVPNLKIDYVGYQRCPSITLRSFEEFHGLGFPSVYVDGTRANDTCILTSLLAYDVDQVEIYPQGFTKRPGYATNTHGLILVFTRRQ